MWSQAGGLRRKRTPTRRIPRAGELELGPVVADRQLECDSASGTAGRGQDWGGNHWQALVFGKFGTRGPAITRSHTGQNWTARDRDRESPEDSDWARTSSSRCQWPESAP
jgi:hypothetical protein